MIDELLNNSQSVLRLIFNPWNLILIALVWLALHSAQERFSEVFTKPRIGWRLLPYAPMVFTVPAMFANGPWYPSDLQPTAAMRVFVGCVLAVAAYYIGGILNRAGLPALLKLMGFDKLVGVVNDADRPTAPPPPVITVIDVQDEITKPNPVLPPSKEP